MRFDRTAPLYKNAVTVSQIAKQIVVVTIVVVASFKGFELLVEAVTGEDSRKQLADKQEDKKRAILRGTNPRESVMLRWDERQKILPTESFDPGAPLIV